MTIHEAWDFLQTHDCFKYNHNNYKVSYFEVALDIHYTKVDPETRAINLEEPSKNTKTEVWLECGYPIKLEDEKIHTTHDWDLDCGAKTFEKAIVKLAKLVKQKHGG